MKKIPFTKMEGAGNDFVIMDRPTGDLKKLAVKVCDRTTGIGADGLLALDKSKKADYKMRIINADGSEAEMCGNGVRCLAAYIVRNKHPRKKQFGIETLAGIILAEAKNETALARLSNPKDFRPDVPIVMNGRKIHVHYINSGVPHAIVFVSDLKNIDVASIGRFIRHNQAFAPRGTNVNFVEQIQPNFIHIRTYERGVEDETRACGTGAVASSIVTFLKSKLGSATRKTSIRVLTASGEILQVSFRLDHGKILDVWLKGSAKFIAKGEYYA